MKLARREPDWPRCMPIPKREVDCEQQHAALLVSDVFAAVDFYTKKLDFRSGFTWGDPPSMAGVNLGNVQMFLEQARPTPKVGASPWVGPRSGRGRACALQCDGAAA